MTTPASAERLVVASWLGSVAVVTLAPAEGVKVREARMGAGDRFSLDGRGNGST